MSILHSAGKRSEEDFSDNQPGPLKESKHTDFYYKLEALNEKIRLFKEVFYSSKRDDEKRLANEAIRERHR